MLYSIYIKYILKVYKNGELQNNFQKIFSVDPSSEMISLIE